MRIAISGSHRAGKSTLVQALASRSTAYETVDEPYHALEEDGHEFSHPPSLEDFEAQLERSIELLRDEAPNVVFDRCPLDLVAYAVTHEDGDAFDLADWLPRIREVMATLDLVVFVPVEHPDAVRLERNDDPARNRELVDEKLRELLIEDALELELDVLEVKGPVEQRLRTVLNAMR